MVTTTTDWRRGTHVRGLDEALWARLRVEAILHKQGMGALLNDILGRWLREHECEYPGV